MTNPILPDVLQLVKKQQHKKIKQIIICFDDGSYKGYNMNAFTAKFAYLLKLKLQELGVVRDE